MNRRQRIIITCSFLSIFLFSFLINPNFLNVNAKIHSDDEDIEVQLDCELTSNSLEFHGSELIGVGSYDFYDQPELDIGTFIHDRSYIEISELQYPLSTSTNIDYNYINVTDDLVLGDINFNSSEIPEYVVSPPKQSILSVVMDYNTTGNLGSYTGYSDGIGADGFGICWDGTYWYLVRGPDGYNGYLRKYDADWNYISQFNIGQGVNMAFGVAYNGIGYLVVGIDTTPSTYGMYFYKYDADWNYLGKQKLTDVSDPWFYADLTCNGTYWYFMNRNYVYVYDESYVYQGRWSFPGASGNPQGLSYKDGLLYICTWNKADGVRLFETDGTFVCKLKADDFPEYGIYALEFCGDNGDGLGKTGDGYWYLYKPNTVY